MALLFQPVFNGFETLASRRISLSSTPQLPQLLPYPSLATTRRRRRGIKRRRSGRDILMNTIQSPPRIISWILVLIRIILLMAPSTAYRCWNSVSFSVFFFRLRLLFLDPTSVSFCSSFFLLGECGFVVFINMS
ncbi:unnamed protein product [Brassica oleracea var. botrytis]